MTTAFERLRNADLPEKVKDIISSNLNCAIDQSECYNEDPSWREGDAYANNVRDTCIEERFDGNMAMEADDFFRYLAPSLGIRFA